MNGVLVVDKPSGPSSHDVVARVRHALGVRRIGHTGTLDPMASGVLPLVIGRATRLAALLTGTEKEYDATVRFGAATATYDAVADESGRGEWGIRLRPPPPVPTGLTEAAVREALAEFRGILSQTPPPFSAKKTGGIRAYARARRNEQVTPAPARVVAHELTLQWYADGAAALRVRCSSGFYIRSLAHDLGQHLGCGGYLEKLRRTRSGDFSVDDAVPLDIIEAEKDGAGARVIPMDRLLPWLPAIVLTARGAGRAAHGNSLTLDDIAMRTSGAAPQESPPPARVRLIAEDGALLGIAEPRPDGVLHPVIVLV